MEKLRCVAHEACPECRANGRDSRGDNLGVYPDGGKFCFSCGYIEYGNNLNLEKILTRFHSAKPKFTGSIVFLPRDFTRCLPDLTIDWLRQYAITDAEIAQNRIGWSPSHERLIFPVYDSFDNLRMWQGRSFSKNLDRPKTYTEGRKEEVMHVLGDPTSKSLCVVEDIISCIKVARVMPAMPLWGSVLSTKRILDIAEKFTRLVIWLDHDKEEYAIKRSFAARPFFNNRVSVASTRFDPKVYSTEQITKYVQ